MILDGALQRQLQPESLVGADGVVSAPAVAEGAHDQRPVLHLRPPRRGWLRVLEHVLDLGDTLEPVGGVGCQRRGLAARSFDSLRRRSQELELRHLLEGTLANVRGELHLAEEGAKGRVAALVRLDPGLVHPGADARAGGSGCEQEGARAIRHDLRRLEDETSAERGDGGQRLVLGERGFRPLVDPFPTPVAERRELREDALPLGPRPHENLGLAVFHPDKTCLLPPEPLRLLGSLPRLPQLRRLRSLRHELLPKVRVVQRDLVRTAAAAAGERRRGKHGFLSLF